jgi:hypothetical protein
LSNKRKSDAENPMEKVAYDDQELSESDSEYQSKDPKGSKVQPLKLGVGDRRNNRRPSIFYLEELISADELENIRVRRRPS